MSVEVKSSFDGKVTTLIFSTDTYKLIVEVSVFVVRKKGDENNIGTILENYREAVKNGKHTMAAALAVNKESQFERFLKFVTYPFPNFTFEQLIVFYPNDEFRNRWLKKFADKLTSHIPNISLLDKSESFKKVNPNKSVVSGASETDFTLDLNLNSPIKNLLLIDDTIDQGRTVDILLKMLAEKKLINQDTEGKLICIYNNEKSPKFDLKNLFPKTNS